MESLDEDIWDVVIAGTGLPQALLALSVSRSGKRILHVDHHTYYGGRDAGLSLQDAEAWVADLNRGESQTLSHAKISIPSRPQSESSKLASSRSYTLSLRPQIIYAQSKFLPFLVSSCVHEQVDFVAVGSWWLLQDNGIRKIPSSREDVFADATLSMRDKRGLNKFIRFAMQPLQESNEQGQESIDSGATLRKILAEKFGLGSNLEIPLLALSLSPQTPDLVKFEDVLVNVQRHIRSMGYFGPGFTAVTAKYGGNAEIAQVACRAGAVGGGVYLLGHSIKQLDFSPSDESTNPEETLPTSDQGSSPTTKDGIYRVTLTDGTAVRARYVVSDLDNLPRPMQSHIGKPLSGTVLWSSVSIISSPLSHLFPRTSDNGPLPAAAICVVEEFGPDQQLQTPIYLQIHSEETGECPKGQCVVYGSLVDGGEEAVSRLESAVQRLLKNGDQSISASVLWSLSYRSRLPPENKLPNPLPRKSADGRVLAFDWPRHDIAFCDEVLEEVKAAWMHVLGDSADQATFLQFESRSEEHGAD